MTLSTYTVRGPGRNGYITLISVLIIGIMGMSIITSLLLSGVGSSRSAIVISQSAEATVLAHSCAEEALEQIREVTAFTGAGSLELPGGTCTYEVTDEGGEARSITTTGAVGTVGRKMTLEISSIVPTIVVASWEDAVQ
jgi:type II secretory pathway pseudopilin PulG